MVNKATSLNDGLQEQLDSIYQRRYDNAFAWSRVLSMYRALLGLRGCWDMASTDENGDVYDLSGQGRKLTYNGNPVFSNYGLIPFIDLDGTGDYLSRADEAGLDISGTETTIHSTRRGMTLCAWVDVYGLGAIESIASKRTTAGNQRSFLLRKNASNYPAFLVSGAGAADVTVTSTLALTAAQWYFIAGRFTPGTELAIWVNDTKTTNLVGVPASIFNSTAAFEIGRQDGGELWTGAITLVALCAAALSDTIIQSLYHLSRPLFGIR